MVECLHLPPVGLSHKSLLSWWLGPWTQVQREMVVGIRYLRNSETILGDAE
jgi:hypothetical protein